MVFTVRSIYHEHCELLQAFGISWGSPKEKEDAASTEMERHTLTEAPLVRARN